LIVFRLFLPHLATVFYSCQKIIAMHPARSGDRYNKEPSWTGGGGILGRTEIGIQTPFEPYGTSEALWV
jgi:hypothetical protein